MTKKTKTSLFRRQRPTARGRGAGLRGRGRRGRGTTRQFQQEDFDDSDEWTEDLEDVEREEFFSRSGPKDFRRPNWRHKVILFDNNFMKY